MFSQKFIILLIALYLSCYKVLGLDLNNYNLILTQVTNSSPDSHARSTSCFDYYMTTMKEISDQFEKSCEICMDDAKSAYAKAEEDSLQQQRNLQERAQNSCNSLNGCECKDSGAKAFECYVSEGFATAKDFYKLSSDASTYLADMQSEFRRIDRQQQSCISRAQRVFNEDSDEAMDDLSKCLKGNPPYPVPSPSAAVPLHHYKVF